MSKTTDDKKAETNLKGEYVIFAEEVAGYYEFRRAVQSAERKLTEREVPLVDIEVDGQLQLIVTDSGTILRFVSNV